MSLIESTTSTGYTAAGQTLDYRYLVTNSGTTAISSIAVESNLVPAAAIICPQSSLAPDAAQTCTGTYTTTQADVNAESVTNTATATGTGPFANPVSSNQSSVTVDYNPPRCYTGAWPSSVSGTSTATPTDAQGLYVTESNGTWTVYFTHPTPAKVPISGTITTNGTFTNVEDLNLETDDHVSTSSADQITFQFFNYGGLDGVAFVANCGSTVTIGIDGAPVSFFVGNPATIATSTSTTFTRSN